MKKLVERSLPVIAIVLIVSACGDNDDVVTPADQTTAPSSVVESGSDGADEVLDPPPPESVEETFRVAPENPQPGEPFEGFFDESKPRGGFLTMHMWDGAEWGEPLYSLESDANGGGGTVRLDTIEDGVDFVFDDYGVIGPGPDGFAMPDEAEAGYWRLCLANSGYEACVQITVE